MDFGSPSPLIARARRRLARAVNADFETYVYRFMYSSDVNGSASSVSRIRLSFMIPSCVHVTVVDELGQCPLREISRAQTTVLRRI